MTEGLAAMRGPLCVLCTHERQCGLVALRYTLKYDIWNVVFQGIVNS